MPNRRTGRFFTDIWRSASDMRFYGEAAARPFGAALRHLAKVALLLGAVLAAVIVVGLMSFNHAVAWCMDNLPVITVKNGEASADVIQVNASKDRRGICNNGLRVDAENILDAGAGVRHAEGPVGPLP